MILKILAQSVGPFSHGRYFLFVISHHWMKPLRVKGEEQSGILLIASLSENCLKPAVRAPTNL